MKHLASLLLVFTIVAPVGADELVLRGNYWRDRNTRVIQPEADLSKETSTGTTIGAHYLLDTITSASVAAGVVRDQPFTELRNEVGFRVGQRIGPTQHNVSYSYSSESDYWAHSLSIASTFDLFQKNSTLGLVTSYGSDTIAQRQGPTIYNPLGGLQKFGFIASWTQVLAKASLLTLEYDLGVVGFGSAKGKVTGTPNAETGFQSNAYRSVLLGGSPARDTLPFQRVRQSFTGAVYLFVPVASRIMPYLAFRPSYRFYLDDWGIRAHTVELRTHLPIGPTELRVLGRFYTQSAASFIASDASGNPDYHGDAARGLACTGCSSEAFRGAQLYFSADPKLSAFSSAFLELRLLVKLSPIQKWTTRKLPRWLSEGRVEISYGHYFTEKLPRTTFGDADLAGLSFAFPL